MSDSDAELAALLDRLRHSPALREALLRALLSPSWLGPSDELEGLARAHDQLATRVIALTSQLQRLKARQDGADAAFQGLEEALADLAAEARTTTEQLKRLSDRVTFLAARQERHEALLASLTERIERLEVLLEAVLRQLRQPEHGSHPH
ncbi:hypothetical protein [Thermorudis peleae]|uniref:hypothetical protein n=1 Tax=Thermorudis peleae TaxID=1382356 RepID=UPI0005702D62|nr:hypothetical protein [Thermorudis peleae]